jgi:hypothetical protein
LVGSRRILACSASAPRGFTAEASLALARSTAVLHAAEAIGPVAVMVWGAGPRRRYQRSCYPPAGRWTTRPRGPTLSDQRHRDQEPSEQQPQRGRPPQTLGRRLGCEVSTAGPSRWTPSSAKYCRMALSRRARSSCCSGGILPPSPRGERHRTKPPTTRTQLLQREPPWLTTGYGSCPLHKARVAQPTRSEDGPPGDNGSSSTEGEARCR